MCWPLADPPPLLKRGTSQIVITGFEPFDGRGARGVNLLAHAQRRVFDGLEGVRLYQSHFDLCALSFVPSQLVALWGLKGG